MEIPISDNIVLIGTAHVLAKSVEEVKDSINKYKPDVIAVELCEKRYNVLTNKKQWEETPITELLAGNKAYFFLAQSLIASIQRRYAEYGIEPGAEMLAAIEEAKRNNIEIALIDRDISITIKRAWQKMGFIEKIKIVWELIKALVAYEKEEVEIEKLMNEDVISTLMKELCTFAPKTAEVLVNERDQYIAKKILEASKKGKVVAVVGAGHIKGIENYIKNEESIPPLSSLEIVPVKRFGLGKIIAYSIPLLFLLLIGWLAYTGNFAKVANIFLWWFLITGTCSAIGAAIAFGHPYSIITAFIAAPFTTLHPALAAGWFAGIVEAKVRTPRVKDFQQLKDIKSTKDFLSNKVIRILLVTAITNVGASIGTFIALPYVLRIGGII